MDRMNIIAGEIRLGKRERETLQEAGDLLNGIAAFANAVKNHPLHEDAGLAGIKIGNVLLAIPDKTKK